MLRAPDHLGALHTRLVQLALQLRDDLADVALALRLLLRDVALQLVVDLGVEEAERVVLQLALHSVDAEPMGERRVDVERLLRDLDLLLGLQVPEGAHVVGAIGELDQDDADVARHRQEHLAEVLRLLLLARGEVDLADLGDPVDQAGDLLAEHVLQLRQRGERVLDGVVQEAGRHAGDVESQVGDDPGDLEGVGEVGLAGQPSLAAMHLLREFVGPLDGLERRRRAVGPDLVQKVNEGHALSSAKRARARSTMACAISSGVRRSVSITRSYRA